MAHQNRLANAHVLVFGGTSGIGFAAANMALSQGAHVTISGSAQPKTDEKVKKLRSFYPDMEPSNMTGVACDLLDKENMEANLKAFFDKVTQSGKNKLDHIVFCAGNRRTQPVVNNVTVDSALDGFTVRYLAPAIIGKLLSTGQYMSLTTASSLTLTSGTNTHRPMPGWTYAASSGAAVEGLVRGFAVDLAPLRVNLVVPGAIQTELLQGMIDRLGEDKAAKMRKQYSLMDAWGQPENIAEAYGYLMKDRFATGSTVMCDGGRLLVI